MTKQPWTKPTLRKVYLLPAATIPDALLRQAVKHVKIYRMLADKTAQLVEAMTLVLGGKPNA